MATAPNKYTLITGAQTSVPGLVYVDANGDMAMPTTPFYLSAAGLLVPAPVDSSGNPQVSLTGSSPPLTAAAPRLIKTIPYTDFAANTTAFTNLGAGVFSRNARRRTLIVYNTLNEPIAASAITWAPFDSSIAITGSNNQAISYTLASSGITAGNQMIFVDSPASSDLSFVGGAFDTANVGLPMGATAPTSGNVYVYVTEQI